jgi:hypothetical protein
LGLVLFTTVSLILFLIVYNLFSSLNPKFKKDKLEIYMDTFQLEKEVIHDTVYIDKPHVKSNDTPKNVTNIKPKNLSIAPKERDTIITDTIK